MTARCPVCLRLVTPTRRNNNIAAHLDGINHVCHATGEPFRITYPINQTSPPPRTGHQKQVA